MLGNSGQVRIIIPWSAAAAGSSWRSQALECCAGVWRGQGFPVTIAEGGEPWVKADPIYRAALEVKEDLLIVADADVICYVERALHMVAEEGALWAVPHDEVWRLGQDATREVIRCEGATLHLHHIWHNPLEMCEPPYRGLEGGGVVVVPRETLLSVPPDCRFVGWGQEDDCWGVALNELVGKPWRGTEHLLHLWHEPQERITRRRGNLEGWLLRVRYMDARGHPDEMRALIEEGRPCSQTSSSAT